MEKDLKGGAGDLPIQPEEGPNTWADAHQKWYAVKSARVMIPFPAEEDSGPDETITGPDAPDSREAPEPQLHSDQEEAAASPQEGLLFCGAVRDENNKAVEGAAVMVFACCRDNTERLLGYTISGIDGNYLINLPDLPDYGDITGFIVRAGGTPRETGKAHGSRAGYERDFQSFLRIIYNNPNKSLQDLVKSF